MQIEKLLPQLKNGDKLHRLAAEAIESLMPKPKNKKEPEPVED
jgi:hypothetical protein